MAVSPHDSCFYAPSAEIYLLGRIDYGTCLALQRRMVFEALDRDDGQIRILLCEHPPIVTIGRGGNPSQVHLHSSLLRTHQIDVRWVGRGGGCLVHAPGQLAVYPVVPLGWHGMTVGQYLDRLQTAILQTLAQQQIAARCLPDTHGFWGRTGQLAALGVAVRNWVTYHGAFINVSPALGLFRLLESGGRTADRMSSLVAERGGSVRMTSVRTALVEHLTAALGAERFHVYNGHPLLKAAATAPAGDDV